MGIVLLTDVCWCWGVSAGVRSGDQDGSVGQTSKIFLFRLVDGVTSQWKKCVVSPSRIVPFLLIPGPIVGSLCEPRSTL